MRASRLGASGYEVSGFEADMLVVNVDIIFHKEVRKNEREIQMGEA